ncbi:hypothetical protein ACOSP7_032877 [Xanthoceras sorbifolium]
MQNRMKNISILPAFYRCFNFKNTCIFETSLNAKPSNEINTAIETQYNHTSSDSYQFSFPNTTRIQPVDRNQTHKSTENHIINLNKSTENSNSKSTSNKNPYTTYDQKKKLQPNKKVERSRGYL